MTSTKRTERLLHLGLALALLVLLAAARPWTAGGAALPPAAPSVAVSWPPSPGLLVAEVVTGGASASDEYVELYNASSSPAQLDGLELVYVTASGSTVTRKGAWTDTVLEPRRHLLLANSAGVWAQVADELYSGGFAATGGSLVLRSVGGETVDSLSWGDATSSFVEGSPAVAPPPSASLERLPGGLAGNGLDSNDNAADAVIQGTPIAQPLSADPAPADAQPAACTNALPPGGPAGEQTTAPVISIASARQLPLGTVVTTAGRLTLPTNLIDDGHHAYIEADGAGIALWADDASLPDLAPGSDVLVAGELADRAGELTLVLGAAADDVVVIGLGPLPEPPDVPTGSACEPYEARLIAVEGMLMGEPLAIGEGLLTTVDDGSGGLIVFASSASSIGSESLADGSLLRLVGVLAQISIMPEYRLLLRSPADVIDLDPAETFPPTTVTPTPTSTATPSPTVTPTLRVTPVPATTPPSTPMPSLTAGPSPAPTAAPVSIADARVQQVGTTQRVRGAVTALPGRILGDTTLVIQDATAGICVKLAAPIAEIELGSLIDVEGPLAAPYGNLELRPSASGVAVLENGVAPLPVDMPLAGLDESTEGLLARVSGTLRSIETGTGTLTLMLDDGSAEGRVFLHAPLGMTRADFAVGQLLDVVGIVGDRLGLYRVWPRDRTDIAVIAQPPTPTPEPTATPRPTATQTSSPTPGGTSTPRPTATRTPSPTPARTSTPSGSPSGGGPVISIFAALGRTAQVVTVEGIVTSAPGLLDTSAERVTVQDATAGVLVRLPANQSGSVGEKVRLSGLMGTYYGAPQLTASGLSRLGTGTPDVSAVRNPPIAPGLEWRLVSVSGVVDSVRRDGAAWRAELTIAGGSVPIDGLERSGIPATALVEGRMATVTGIVKRAYPTATDQRLAIVPRSSSDISLAGSGTSAGPSTLPPGSQSPRPSSSGGATGIARATPSAASAPDGADQPTLVALSDLDAHVGQIVRFGATLTSITEEMLSVDDGTARVVVRLTGAASAQAATLASGDLLNVVGLVGRDPAGTLEVIVSDRTGLVRQPVLPAPEPAASDAPPASATESSGAEVIEPVPDRAPPSVALGMAGALGLAALLLAAAATAGQERRRRARSKVAELLVRLRARLPASP